ncbi:MAG: TlpA family protein disulfide reductase [Xanthomonadales bacterium]|nr:Thiol-disulfide oxidoreductase ResA [Xanthomonadales bacterium]MCC6593475.1 TlpA family protein disulfide reductase [Xanthomonadales bacterium]MCE7929890.1 TlpA family protein disulfide reductase [Xanthomonadales bacterium PRO6]
MTRLFRPLTLALALCTAAQAAPIELAVTTLDGATFDLAQQRGQWVVINYWATWCGPCIKEMPELDELDHARTDLVVLGLAFEETTPEDLEAFLKQRPVRYPIAVVDVYAPPKAFAVPKGLPTTHLVAPDGSLAKSFLGPVTRADIEKAIAAAAVD